MQCEEMDWLGILSTVIFTGMMSVLPLPESKLLSVPIAFAELYALLLLMANFYFILYVEPFLADQANQAVSILVPLMVFFVSALLVCLKRMVISIIAFFVSNAITASLGPEISLAISAVVSVLLSFVVRKTMDTKAAEDTFMYATNAILLVFSIMAVGVGEPGTARNPEPPNFYVLCNARNGSVTILSNIVHMALLLFYIGAAVLLRVSIVSCYELCSWCAKGKNKNKKKRKRESTQQQQQKIVLKPATYGPLEPTDTGDENVEVTIGENGSDGEVDEIEIELGNSLTITTAGDVKRE
jgi:hypothetical protein